MFSAPMGLVKAKASGFVDSEHIEMTLKSLIGKVVLKASGYKQRCFHSGTTLCLLSAIF